VKEKFKIPMIVRQKGLIDDTLKMYMENKALQYIKQLKEKTISGIRYALLIGTHEIIEEENCLVVSGIINLNCKTHEEINDYFMKQIKGYLTKQVDKYFKEKEIVGILCIDKENNIEKEDNIKEIFNKIFRTDFSILFMQERSNEEIYYKLSDCIEELNGYFIYYDKNENMKVYAEQNPISEQKNDVLENDVKITKEKQNVTVIQKREKKPVLPNLISTSLFILSVILGLGLVRNIKTVNLLENNIDNMKNMYDTLASEVKTQNDELKNAIEKKNVAQAMNMSSQEEKKNENDLAETEDKYVDYEIKEGDNLKLISKKFFGNEEYVKKIMDINGIENENYIQIGDVIKIPK